MGYVVVVESDKLIAKVLAEYFRSEGYRCGVAHSKSVAQRFLRHIRPDLLLIECQLCDGDGLRLARLALRRGVPAMTMSTGSERAAEATAAGLAHLQKPFELTALSNAVSAVFNPRTPAAGTIPTLRFPDTARSG